jgi:hypothetical protein
MTATAVRIKSRSGDPDADYFQPRCAECHWKGAMYPNRTVEGRRLATERAADHNRARHVSANSGSEQ